uniref:Uncharacterized protein n=1 Tax=Romanomermis culicivorax TaxID=13658 RepID=A0A915KPX9_ROMCU
MTAGRGHRCGTGWWARHRYRVARRRQALERFGQLRFENRFRGLFDIFSLSLGIGFQKFRYKFIELVIGVVVAIFFGGRWWRRWRLFARVVLDRRINFDEASGAGLYFAQMLLLAMGHDHGADFTEIPRLPAHDPINDLVLVDRQAGFQCGGLYDFSRIKPRKQTDRLDWRAKGSGAHLLTASSRKTCQGILQLQVQQNNRGKITDVLVPPVPLMVPDHLGARSTPILSTDRSEGPKAQALACSQQALENLLGDPFKTFFTIGQLLL